MGQSLRRSLGLLPAITGVILAAGLLAPSAARGDCGDYVTYGNTGHAKSVPGHEPMPGQCHGPGCSQTPTPAPMPQAPPHLRILTDDSIPLSGGDEASESDSSFFGIESSAGAPVRRSADVFHPPR